MADGERFRIEGSAEEILAQANQLKASIQRADELVGAAGSEMKQYLRSQAGKLAGPSPEEIAKGTAALRAETRAVDELNAALERTRAARAAAIPPTGIVVPPVFSAGRAGTASEEARAAEEEAAIRARLGQRAGQSAADAMRAQARSLIVAPPTVYNQGPTGGVVGRAAQEAQREAEALTQAAAVQRTLVEQAQAEALARERSAAAARATASAEARQRGAHTVSLYTTGAAGFAAAGRVPTKSERTALTTPDIKGWTAADAAVGRYSLALGQFDRYNRNASISTGALSADLTRLGIAQAETSNELRKHGALTTEFITALARGETTVSELGYQVQATAAKFAGWALAGAAVYALFDVFTGVKKGAVDGTNAVEQLRRTLNTFDTGHAAQGLTRLSQDTNVSMAEAGDAVFQFSRSFHNLDDAVAMARNGISVLKLDNVSLADSVKLSTAVHQQWGASIGQLGDMFNMAAAGQREYNARISQMIPLLQSSSGAVRNAGGDFTQFMQIATIFLRQTQLPGAQIGTAIARSAAVRARQNAPALVSQFGLGRDINPITGEMNWTQLMLDAMKKSTTMNGTQRQQLVNLLFDPRLGSRLGGAFGPQVAPLLAEVTGGKNAISPEATRGSLKEELQTQLKQVQQQLEAFTNSLQRLGAALAASGALTPLGLALRGVVAGLNGLRSFVDVINGLPGPLRTAVEVMMSFRLATLAFTRTRMGAQTGLAGAYMATGLPGAGRIRETRQRAELAVGARTAMQNVSGDISANIQRQNEIEARQNTLEQQRRNLIAQAGGEEALSAEQLERSNALRSRILSLEIEQTELAASQVAQEGIYAGLQSKLVAVTRVSRNGRLSRDEIAKESAASAGGDAAAMSAATSNAAAQRRVAVQAGELEHAALRERDATVVAAAQRRRLALASDADALAMGEAAAQTTAATARTSMVAKAGGGLLGGLMGLVRALDPITVGLVALPFAFEAIKGAFDHGSDMSQKVKDLANLPATSLQQYMANARKLADAVNRPAPVPDNRITDLTKVSTRAQTTAPSAMVNWSASARTAMNQLLAQRTELLREAGGQSGLDAEQIVRYRSLSQQITALAQRNATRTRPTTTVSTVPHTDEGAAEIAGRELAIGNVGQRYIKQLEKAGPALSRTVGGQVRLQSLAGQYAIAVAKLANDQLAGWPQQIANADAAFAATLNSTLQSLTTKRAATTGTQAEYDKLFRLLAGTSTKTMEENLKALDSATNVYGVGAGTTDTAVSTLAVLAEQYRNRKSDPESMQALQSDMSSVTGMMNKQVTNFLNAAKAAPTMGGTQANIDRARTSVDTSRTQIQRWFQAAINNAGHYSNAAEAISELQGMEQQMLNELATGQQQAAQAAIDLTKGQAQLNVAQVQGISPESDIRRAILTVEGDQHTIDVARASRVDAQTISALMQTLLNDQLSLRRNQADYARSVAQAREEAWVSSDTGTSPRDDLIRASRTVTVARDNLARDQAQGRGEQQMWQDQQALDQAIFSYKQAQKQDAQRVTSDAQAAIQARADLASANTLDPVQQATEQLRADTAKLSTIHPQQFATYEEYQTALMEQQAKVAQDVRTRQTAIVDQRTRTLQFQLHTQQITDQQYVQGLENLLKMTKLTRDQRQQILGQIYDVQHQTAVNLNTADIRLPTTYEIRRALLGAARRGRTPSAATAIQNNVQHTVNVSVNVTRDADMRKLSAVLDDALRSNVTGTAQAMGLI